MNRPTEVPRAGTWSRIVTLAAALMLVFSCNGAEDPTGGETHFLRACAAGSACGSDQACLCGVCTRSCAGLADCRGLPSAECMAATESRSCTDAPAQLCDVGCSIDADCAALSSTHRCDDGRCRAGSSSSDGTGGESGSATAGAPGGAGGPSPCPSGEVDANQVLVVGDAFFGTTHQITAYLEDLSRAAGVLSVGERYRDNSSIHDNALALGGNGIANQYASAAAEVDVRVVIMSGGGADVLLGSCDPAASDCPALVNASIAAEELLARMATDGVERVVYPFYPDPVDLDLRANMDVLRPLIEAVCQSSSVPCIWLDLRSTFADNYDAYVQADGKTPTAAGAQATAAAIWATMQQNCVAQ